MDLSDKIKKAEKLRRKPNIFLSLFQKPDYVESGVIFTEVAKESTDEKKKILYFKEAAETFLLEKSEYAIWKACECYKAAFFIKNDEDFFLKYVDCLFLIERYMLAGQALFDQAVKTEDYNTAVKLSLKAVEAFEKERSCPYHIKKIKEFLLSLHLKNKNLSQAAEIFKYLDEKHSIQYYKLCNQILLFIIKGESFVFEEDLNTEENEIIMVLLNRREEVPEILKKFISRNNINENVKIVFDLCLNEVKPENDIC